MAEVLPEGFFDDPVVDAKVCELVNGLFHWNSTHPLWKTCHKNFTEGVQISNGSAH